MFAPTAYQQSEQLHTCLHLWRSVYKTSYRSINFAIMSSTAKTTYQPHIKQTSDMASVQSTLPVASPLHRRHGNRQSTRRGSGQTIAASTTLATSESLLQSTNSSSCSCLLIQSALDRCRFETRQCYRSPKHLCSSCVLCIEHLAEHWCQSMCLSRDMYPDPSFKPSTCGKCVWSIASTSFAADIPALRWIR
jgi:hypothetical protein